MVLDIQKKRRDGLNKIKIKKQIRNSPKKTRSIDLSEKKLDDKTSVPLPDFGHISEVKFHTMNFRNKSRSKTLRTLKDP